jgi:hypothetical protein
MCSYGDPAVTEAVELTVGEPFEGVAVPAGTVVTVEEIDLPVVDGLMPWATPVFTADGVTDNCEGTATCTVGAAGTVGVTVTNKAEAEPTGTSTSSSSTPTTPKPTTTSRGGGLEEVTVSSGVLPLVADSHLLLAGGALVAPPGAAGLAG